MKLFHSRAGRQPDFFLIALVFVITVFGLIMLASASSELGSLKFNDSYYYLKHQILYGLSVGLVGFFAGFAVPYQRYRKFAFAMLLVGIVLLVLVFTRFGTAAYSASRWLHFGPVRFQPAEIMKLTFIIYLAAWLSAPDAKRSKHFLEGLLPFLIVTGVVAGLLIIQPATSTVAILLGAALAVYFLSGADLRYILGTILVAAAAIALIIYATPYRRARIMGFLDQNQHQQTSNYQVNQALIAIGAGGIQGAGYGQSIMKTSYLPAPVDDSIFAVIGEELGFAGAGALIALFALLVLRFFWLAKRTRDPFGRFMLVGFGTVIALQSLVNVGAISGVLPLTGVPLPFVSYGGTALAVFLTMGGIAANISRAAQG